MFTPMQEFYFKCKSHESAEDDMAAALNLIKTNVKEVPCIACMEAM